MPKQPQRMQGSPETRAAECSLQCKEFQCSKGQAPLQWDASCFGMVESLNLPKQTFNHDWSKCHMACIMAAPCAQKLTGKIIKPTALLLMHKIKLQGRTHVALQSISGLILYSGGHYV